MTDKPVNGGRMNERTKLYIKNMVCPRCITAVGKLLESVRAKPADIRLGEVLLEEELSPEQKERLSAGLQAIGFELLDDARRQQIEKIKAIIIEHIHHREEEKFPFAEVLSSRLRKEYPQLSRLFSETEGLTIEQFVIGQKIEKVKELLAYDQLSLSEIAYRLGYSSVAHLSSQFKKITGLTPSRFKAQGIQLRKPLDGLFGNKL
jgi:AraC family transcriptional regulator